MHSNKSKCINTPLSGDNAATGLFEGKYEMPANNQESSNLNQTISCTIHKKIIMKYQLLLRTS